MDFLKQNKTTIGLGVLVVVALLVYFTYFSGSSSPTVTESDANSGASAQLLIMLNNLHTIKLDNSLFEDPAFKSLTNFGVTIPPQAVGRRNPFLPLTTGGSGGTPITIPKSSQ
jgi:hypothetical protein